MKKRIIQPLLLSALIAALNLIPAERASAQTFRTLHSFTAGILYYAYDEIPVGLGNSDGLYPNSLILSGNTLYGTAGLGGGGASGALFAVNTDGTGFTNLHNFELPDLHGFYVPETNPDGINPNGLILSGNNLYGTAEKGGLGFDSGTLFAMNTDGRGFTNLHNFTANCGCFVGVANWDGAHPKAGMILSGNTLYGTASVGSDANAGTVFALNKNGTGFAKLHSFKATRANSFGVSTNSDGANPYAGLILSGSTLYGTAQSGGSSGNGTVFALGTSGAGFTNLHGFTAAHTNSFGVPTNSDGARPWAGLLLAGSTLYGTASYGGSAGAGTVFAVNTNGTGFRVLHSFTGTNGDGADPVAGLILSGSTLYGTAYRGGSSGFGTVFAVNTNGLGFTNLHRFTGTNGDGAHPQGGLILSGNSLYGTTAHGGSAGAGTVFSLSFAPQLTITPSGSNVVLSWPTNVAGFDYTGYTLQSSTSLDSPSVWSTNSPAPVIIAGQNTVTNPINGARQFYRLVQ